MKVKKEECRPQGKHTPWISHKEKTTRWGLHMDENTWWRAHTDENTWWRARRKAHGGEHLVGQDNGQEEHPQICTIRLLQLARDHTKNISQMGLREIAANIT